uniref:Uncharacterized protein n=1 Tax=Magallana gigas TaxID=29159 RepID=K1QSM1_MAGGI
MPRGKPKGNKDKGATCSGAGGGPSSLDSRKRRAESQLDFQQPTLSAIQVTQVPPTAVDEHQQAATSTGIENPTTSASTWQGTPEMPQLLASTMYQIAINVSQNIKAKIISSAYVDLALLLSNTNVIPTEKSIYINEKGELMTRETSKPSVKIDSIEKWTDAFIIYSSIYSSAHIGSVQGLFKYLHDVRLGAVRVGGLGFKSYDEQFRLRRSMDPSIPWGKVDSAVWCVGSSIIKHAFLAAMLRTGGINLGLERLGIKIWWQGLEEAPDFLVIHGGGNDLGDPDWPLAELIEHMSESITSLADLLPKTKLVWSQILPRKSYRYSSDLEAMERNRKRFNRATACQIQDLGGGHILSTQILLGTSTSFWAMTMCISILWVTKNS